MRELLDLRKKDNYNFLLPYGLGDTLMLCGFRKAWEEKNKGKIHFIIKPAHEVVMKMYGVDNYTKMDFSLDECKNLEKKIDNSFPREGEIYICHPEFNEEGRALLCKFNNLDFNFFELYKFFLHLDSQAVFDEPSIIPNISKKIAKNIENISSLEKIILISPEANSVPPLSNNFWEGVSEEMSKKGYSVIVNAVKDPLIKNSTYLKLTVSDAVAIAFNCHRVFSLRSGFCDLIHQIGKRLTVYYGDENIKKLYGLNEIFKSNNNEIILNKKVPLVSVVTVTKDLIKSKRREAIIQCIESVKNQTYPNIEHIIIDSASKEGTLDLFLPYEKEGVIKVYSKEDAGIYDAMNRGRRLAKGKYIAFLNSDDFYHNTMAIEKSISCLEETNADFSFGITKVLDQGTVRIWHPCEVNIVTQMPFCHQSAFFKKEVLEEFPFDLDFKLAADYDLLLRLYLNRKKGVCVKDEIVTYSLGGISGKLYEECVNEYKKVYKKNYGNIVSEIYFNKMVRENYVPKKIKDIFLKLRKDIFSEEINRYIRINIFSIPFFKLEKEKEGDFVIYLFDFIEAIRLKKTGKVFRIFLFKYIRTLKINIKRWR